MSISSWEGETNDYFAKGLSGGRISILPPIRSNFSAEDNIIAGNTGLYGATSGELYINGKVGERFGVRNSGAVAVIEGAGDHCCEYMTGGRVVVLGETGRNFAAGMSGGVAYVWDKNHNFDYFCNMDMVEINLVEDSTYRKELHELIRQHYLYTGSKLARTMLDDWNHYVEDFIQGSANRIQACAPGGAGKEVAAEDCGYAARLLIFKLEKRWEIQKHF